MSLEPDSEIDKDTYKWALQCYNDCEQSFDLSTYALYPDHLEIIQKCYFPNALNFLTSDIDLIYNYTDISEYLKIKN